MDTILIVILIILLLAGGGGYYGYNRYGGAGLGGVLGLILIILDRTSKFAFVELHEKATTATSRDFLLRLIEAVPYKIHTVLTENGIHFTTPGAGARCPLDQGRNR